MTESNLKIRLDREDLFKSSTQDLTRLMLSLDPQFAMIKEGETDGEYRGRCVNAIQRWEKEYARRPRKRADDAV